MYARCRETRKNLKYISPTRLQTTEHVQHSEKLWKRVFNFVCWKFLQMVLITLMIALLEEEERMVQWLHLFHCYRVSAPVLVLPHTIFSNFLIQRKSLTPWHSACARRWWLWLVPSIHIQWYRSPITLLASLSNLLCVFRQYPPAACYRTFDFKYLMSCKLIQCVLKA